VAVMGATGRITATSGTPASEPAGAGPPLLLIGTLSRETLARRRSALQAIGARGQWVLGALLVWVGVAILAGWDRGLESWVVDHSPEWLTRLTTRYRRGPRRIGKRRLPGTASVATITREVRSRRALSMNENPSRALIRVPRHPGSLTLRIVSCGWCGVAR